MLSDIQEIGDDRPDQYLFYPSKELKKSHSSQRWSGKQFPWEHVRLQDFSFCDG